MHSNGSIVTIAELEGGEGRASMSNSTVEIGVVTGMWGGSFLTSRGASQVTAVGQSRLYKQRGR